MGKIALSLVLVLMAATPVLLGQALPNSGGPAALVVVPGVQSDGPADKGGAPEYGTLATSAYSLVAQAFRPLSSQVTYEFGVYGGNLAVYCTNTAGPTFFEAPIHLPTGALITSVEFRICDTSPTKGLGTFLSVNDKTGSGSATQTLLVESTPAETPGCVNRTFTPSSPIGVDNDKKAYSLEINLGGFGMGGDDTLVLCHARVYYKRRVSLAPGTATFADVPTTSPQFQFVEALAAAGITAGCGGGNYCPNDPITRGQMAVFLATSLGLHWPN